MSDVELAEKQCSTCEEVKPLSEFHRQRDTKDGRRYNCKRCSIAYVREWKRRKKEEVGEEAFRRREREAVRKHRADPENRERGRKLSAAYEAATSRLRESHRVEFDELYRREKYERDLL